MRWVRSWPESIPQGRAHVVDDLPRLIIRNYDYTPLGDLDEDVCLLEWDMALSLEDRLAFEHSAAVTPSHVLVAPYRLYEGRQSGGPVWAHRRVLSVDRTRWIVTGESHCELFGFGCIYMPRTLIRAFLEAPVPERGRWPSVQRGDYTDCRFTDQTFSTWHYWRSGGAHHHEGPAHVRIAWHISPVHLHYKLPSTEVTNHEQLPVSVLQRTQTLLSGI